MSAINFAKVPHQFTFDDDVFPGVVVNDGSVATLGQCEAWVQENKLTLTSALADTGALLFRGFPVDSAESFDRFSAAFSYPNFTYQESLSNAVRVNFTERVFTANEAPKELEIYLHHEMAQTPIYPSKLFFFCQAAADEGGATPLCRSDKVYEALVSEDPDLAKAFAEKGLKYTSIMPAENDPGSGQGRSWRSTLSVNNKADAENKLKELGYTWEWLHNDSLRAVTPVLPAVLALDNDKHVFFNQLIAAYMGWKGVRENPASAICFGDNSPIPSDGLALAVSLAERFTFDLCWRDGDVALVDNYMVMHGRRPYSGERKRQVLVALVAA